MPEQKTDAQLCREWMERHLPEWLQYREAMVKEEEFLDGDRYENDQGPYNKDRRLNQIRGQEIQDTVRHIAAKATEKPRSIEPRPIDRVEDPDLSEIAASLVENELASPWKMFDDVYEEAIIDSREKRLGIVWMDWVPSYGEFGEIFYRRVDPKRVMWDGSWHPHHPLCDVFVEEKRLDVDLIHRTYKGTDWVQADRHAFNAAGEVKEGIPLLRGGHGWMARARTADDNKATLWFFWYKNDKTKGERREKEDSDQLLAPEARYMSCVTGCGYRSKTEGEIAKLADAAPQPGMDPLMDAYLQLGELPEEMPGCPLCESQGMVGHLERIDSKSEDEILHAYSRGKKLVILAPFSAAPDDKPVYKGKWPIPSARSFPLFIITSYTKGGRPMGPSDTALMWDQQVASDQLRTLAVQRVFEHRNYWVLPSAGITDFRNQRFVGRDDQFNYLYKDMTKVAEWGDLSVQVLNGTGLDPAWPIAFSAVQDALTAYRGMHDQGPIEERSKAKSGVALQTENAIGEVPVAHFNRRKNRELSRFYGVVWDYIRATYTPERLSRLNIDGVDMMQPLRGDDMPNYDFVISDTPDFTGLDEAKNKAFEGIMNAYQQAIALQLDPISVIELYAETNNLPRSIVRKFQKMLSDMQQQAQQAQTAMGGLPPEMGMEEDMGFNGNGMVPEPGTIGVVQ